MTLTSILLQAQEGNSWSGMLMIIAMIVIFYFFMIRPQSKKQKEIKKAREAMDKGDKIVTAGGIFGTIRSINNAEGTIMMEVAPNVTIKVSREQVFPVQTEAPKKD
ncbi:MAG: preprotein translocase subunit YajC [Muribaculaceae bacterium]|nr:preprotein translocase subunit YajC [Muribaculaceae bacterium]